MVIQIIPFRKMGIKVIPQELVLKSRLSHSRKHKTQKTLNINYTNSFKVKTLQPYKCLQTLNMDPVPVIKPKHSLTVCQRHLNWIIHLQRSSIP